LRLVTRFANFGLEEIVRQILSFMLRLFPHNRDRSAKRTPVEHAARSEVASNNRLQPLFASREYPFDCRQTGSGKLSKLHFTSVSAPGVASSRVRAPIRWLSRVMRHQPRENSARILPQKRRGFLKSGSSASIQACGCDCPRRNTGIAPTIASENLVRSSFIETSGLPFDVAPTVAARRPIPLRENRHFVYQCCT